MAQTNFLIGRGEVLTTDIGPPKSYPSETKVYSLNEAKEHLVPQIKRLATQLRSLPAEVCPNDYSVARFTLNPSYIAKSYFPKALMRATNFESVGSRMISILPRKWSKKGEPTISNTTEIFVAGKRNIFDDFGDWAEQLNVKTAESIDLTRIEDISSFLPEDKIRPYTENDSQFFEVVIHLIPTEDSSFIKTAFLNYAKKLGIETYQDIDFQSGSLWFIPIECSNNLLAELSKFVFVRTIRPMPVIRGIRPLTRSNTVRLDCELPDAEPISSSPKVAVLDAGIPEKHPLSLWLRSYRKLDPNADDIKEGNEHGLAVTSAFLFGPIEPGETAERPYSPVDHLRVLDKDSETEDPLELYRTLGFVEEVLLSRQYEFINLSLGPDLPVEDTDVHAWTSVIDDILSDGNTFLTVAVGNNGNMDQASGNARIQVPSDSVNSISVGSADNIDESWVRANYSAIGPGRSPGVIKPDLMAFGGSTNKYFHALAPGEAPSLSPMLGTSFASPYLLRNAVGIRSILGNDLSPLAIKALLVHGADKSTHNKIEVGWGKIPEDISAVITSPPGTARIIYKGELKPGKYLRAGIPLPINGLKGRINLRATFCYASPIEPQDASSYTQAGLEITFRPDETNIKLDSKKKPKQNAESKSFFKLGRYATEDKRRSDAGKWETVLMGDENMLGSTLNHPVFDIHYNARTGGGPANNANKIPYALVISITANKHPELYNDILNAYPSLLVPIEPKVRVPIPSNN